MSDYEDRPGIEPDPVDTDDQWVEHLEELETSRMMDYDDQEQAA